MNKFDFEKNYVLENDRVKLRPLLKTDLEHLLSFSLNEPTLWQYIVLSILRDEWDGGKRAALEAKVAGA